MRVLILLDTKIQVEYPYMECLVPEVFQISDLFQILEYLHKISLGWHPNVNRKCICVLYTPYTHSLKIILYIFNNLVHETKCTFVEPSKNKGVTISTTHMDNLWLFGSPSILNQNFYAISKQSFFFTLIQLFTYKNLMVKNMTYH